MRILVALGGNALLRRGEAPDAVIQARHVVAAAEALADMARDHQLIVVHGNGPQIGMLALESAADHALHQAYPLDVLGAQTQGMIGYLISQALTNALPARQVASMVTQTLVHADDLAFLAPTKFVGPNYTEAEAKRLATINRWTVRPDGDSWRRTVASPRPVRVLEAPVIHTLLAAGYVVVCAGGGGIPVVLDQRDGTMHGIEAVVDKDLTAALLAEELDADVLMLLTDVVAVARDFGTPQEQPIHEATPAELRGESFPAGSMGPKIDAVCTFVERTKRVAAIGAMEDATDILSGKAGTQVRPSGPSSVGRLRPMASRPRHTPLDETGHPQD